MSKVSIEALLEILEGDRELLGALAEQGLIDAGAQSFAPEEVETILVSRTLVRELEVNWPGVEVILRLRRELMLTRIRLAEFHKDSLK